MFLWWTKVLGTWGSSEYVRLRWFILISSLLFRSGVWISSGCYQCQGMKRSTLTCWLLFKKHSRSKLLLIWKAVVLLPCQVIGQPNVFMVVMHWSCGGYIGFTASVCPSVRLLVWNFPHSSTAHLDNLLRALYLSPAVDRHVFRRDVLWYGAICPSYHLCFHLSKWLGIWI